MPSVNATITDVGRGIVAIDTEYLRPLQERNVELAREARILEVAGLMEPGRSVEELFQGVDTRMLELETGEFTDAIDPASFDQQVAARDPELAASYGF